MSTPTTGPGTSAEASGAVPSSAELGRGLTLARYAALGLGVLLGLYGAYLLLSRQSSDQIWSATRWLAGGVVFNDGLVAVAALVVGYAVTRLLPRAVRAPVVVGAVVLGSITLMAVPVLLSYGRKDDNPSLLDRDFVGGWFVFAGVVLVCVLVAVVLRLRRARGAPDDV